MELEEIRKRNKKISNYLKLMWMGEMDILDCKTKIQNMFSHQSKENQELKHMLSEISSQLKDRGGFEILTESIDNKIKYIPSYILGGIKN
jgi:hypothetical protein